MGYEQLREKACNIRKNIVKMINSANSGHPGGSLSSVEILTYLYFKEMNIKNTDDKDRDIFILSKGHAAPVLYATLAEKGFYTRRGICLL